MLADKYFNEDRITKKVYDAVIKSVKFLRNSYFQTEDVDGNIVKGDKDMTKELREKYEELICMFYNNRQLIDDNYEQILSQINELNKLNELNNLNSLNKQKQIDV